jgi:hypothetical protein
MFICVVAYCRHNVEMLPASSAPVVCGAKALMLGLHGCFDGDDDVVACSVLLS